MARLVRVFAAAAVVALSFTAAGVSAEVPGPAAEAAAPAPEVKQAPALKMQFGDVTLGSGLASLHVPEGLGYIDPAQAEMLLEELWGNPDGSGTLGMLLPVGVDPESDESWGVVLNYQDDGHVEDDDAAEIDYAELLEEMQSDTEERNEARAEMGFEPVTLMGWAEAPRYDAATKKLYWAKDLRFGTDEERTLNYDVRVLGKEGVLVMSAVAAIDELPAISQRMQAVLPHVAFLQGNRYEDFDPDNGRYAAYGIAGLVAGKAAAKVGFFKGLVALLLASKKLVAVGVVALGAGIAKLFGRK